MVWSLTTADDGWSRRWHSSSQFYESCKQCNESSCQWTLVREMCAVALCDPKITRDVISKNCFEWLCNVPCNGCARAYSSHTQYVLLRDSSQCSFYPPEKRNEVVYLRFVWFFLFVFISKKLVCEKKNLFCLSVCLSVRLSVTLFFWKTFFVWKDIIKNV